MYSIRKSSARVWGWNIGCFLLTFLILVLDMASPLGQISWILYVAVVALTLFSPSVSTNFIALGFAALFMGIGYFGALGEGEGTGFSLLNRIFGLATLGIVSFAVYRSKQFEQKIQYDVNYRGLEAGLASALAAELEIEDLSTAVLDFFTENTEVMVGAFYLIEGKKELKLVTSSGTKDSPQRVMLGEGLLGKQALASEAAHVSPLPNNYMKLSSGTGETDAQHLLLIPMRYGKSTRGVLELGSLQPFSAELLEFVGRAQDMLGHSLVSSLYAKELENALREKSAQAEELQAQQEELRVTNEELEAQSNALRDSQAQLEMQTAELEQQQSLMEKKNDELKARNMELQRIKKDMESNARELAEANRYKSEFLSNMSHELRTPINSILILSQLLAENKEQKLSGEEIEFARTITASGNDLLNLINEILDLSKVEAGMMELNIEPVPLSSVVERMGRFFSPLAEERGIELVLESKPDSQETVGTDQKRLEQILKNLISNAIKFTEEGYVALRVETNNSGGYNFIVEDSGSGIPPEKQQTIFRAFEQVDGTISRKYGGTGLGLSIVKELTRLLNGEISLESEVGKGSRFVLSLPPAVEQKARAVNSAEGGAFESTTSVASTPPHLKAEPIPRPDEGKVPESARVGQDPGPRFHHSFDDDRMNVTPNDRTAVIIEDDGTFAKTLMKIAREMGFKAICCATGGEGLEKIEEYKPSAVLLDMRLPDTNGLTILEYLKASPSLRHIPVHVVSAVSYEQNALAMGAAGYLQKPTSADAIRGAFERVESIISKEIKHVLIVEDDPIQREALAKLVASPKVETHAVGEIQGALEIVKTTPLDCMIIDLRLPDGSGLDLLRKLAELDDVERPPIIVYTGKDLTRDEEMQLRQYSESIIIKGARSPERLLAETTLFLHRVERDLPQDKQKMLREVRERSDSLVGRHVLLVDDDVRNVFALSAALEGQGLKVVAARNGKEAIEKLHRNAATDIILMDIMMPEMDGYEAMGRIRSEDRYKTLPIIALTAKAMKGDDIRCLEAGANDYLSKPVDLDKLLSLMRVWLSSRSGF